MKCGALGATVFETRLDGNGMLNVKFLDDDSMVGAELAEVVKPFSIGTEEQLIIASTINELPEYYFNPLFEKKKQKDNLLKYDPFKITLVASVQSMWELVDQELV